MPFPVEAETTQVYQEGRSALGSLVTRLIAIGQQIISFVLKVAGQIFSLASEHPLGLVLGVANVMIWIS